MERNYPEVYNKFWDKLQLKGNATKLKNGIKFYYEINVNSYISIYCDDESLGVCCNDKEHLYCEMLDACLVPRVKEYI